MTRKKLFRRSTRRGQRGMTLLEIMIVLAILALVMGLVVGPRVIKMFSESKVDIARLTVQKFAHEAFPTWSRNAKDKCPTKLEDLSDYMDKKGIEDPWHNPYKMFCGDNLPPGVKGGFGVMSLGENGKDEGGKGDDITSWE